LLSQVGKDGRLKCFVPFIGPSFPEIFGPLESQRNDAALLGDKPQIVQSNGRQLFGRCPFSRLDWRTKYAVMRAETIYQKVKRHGAAWLTEALGIPEAVWDETRAKLGSGGMSGEGGVTP
jgi:hypothetical protein